MYLFNADDEGFLLLSASKLEEPILAYSTEAPLDLSDMPRDLAVWIDLGVTKISQLNRKEFYYDIGVYDAWRSLGFTTPARDWVIEGPGGNPMPLPTFTREDVGCPYIDPSTKTGPLLGTIMWGQGDGYNEYQDIIGNTSNCEISVPNNGRYVAGCTLVAFGQIMKYHKDYGILPINDNDVVNRVMNKLDTSETTAVSSLLRVLYDQTANTSRDCISGTGAHIYETARALRGNMFNLGFFRYAAAQYFNNHQPNIVLQNIVQYKLPVVLCGFSVQPDKNAKLKINYSQNGNQYSYGTKLGSGHAWVCDGYQEEVQKVKVTNNTTGTVNYQIEHKREFWHMNWGWHTAGRTYGSSNGWYRDDLFSPRGANNGNNLIDYNDIVGFDIDGDGVNDGTYHQGFYYNRSMVVNIIP